MRYLISSGTTNDINIYIQDLLKLNFTLDVFDVPLLNDIGLDKVVDDLESGDALSLVRERIRVLIKAISKRNPKVLLDLENVYYFNSNDEIKADIKINNKIYTYGIN